MGERLSCLQVVRSIQTDPFPTTMPVWNKPSRMPSTKSSRQYFQSNGCWNGFSGLISRLSRSEQLRQRVWRRMRRLMGRGG